MLIFSLSFWVRQHAIDDDARRIAVSAEAASSASLADVRHCLDARGLDELAVGHWKEGGQPRMVFAQNTARHLVVSITDRGQDRLIQFSTRDRRPLRASEREILARCRALPPG
ncbi:hypothetical protein MZO42_17500 [Sphingomonas psychrotolerans]|uniref:Uncharacterized protein n=1 Tax=Sphingomonas psychrotolerans TaxID=1327635 RepID=A0ABU3N7K9_9SPHN|nr:hypothetical protein [Sphingomonas psychrotolerans]MDT8760499.1 hypothetical protein [Sphingomonas psychrotolerans]